MENRETTESASQGRMIVRGNDSICGTQDTNGDRLEGVDKVTSFFKNHYRNDAADNRPFMWNCDEDLPVNYVL